MRSDEIFTRLKIGSWSELSLIIPHKYEDLRLHHTILPNKYQAIDATIQNVYRGANSLQITFYAHNLEQTLHGVLFSVKPYMLHQFQVGLRGYFYGLVNCKGYQCSMSMPRKIANVGIIAPRYKTVVRNDILLRFIQENLDEQKLLGEGIKQEIAKEVLRLHFPDDEILKQDYLHAKSLDALKYIELFSYMKQLSKKRRYFPSSVTKNSTCKEWCDSLPFKLTNEQKKAIEDIQKDFAKPYAAKRMIVGDVGSGKTMVILASVVMMLPYRSILMAPTTILANQLYEEAKKYLHVKIALVTNKTKKMDLEEFDFIIGTHALLYRELPKADLIMVDEQHRFGTRQRNALEKLVQKGEKKPHYLQFSATPIPRTQAMIETAHIDVSLITTTPFKKNITSKVIRKSDFKKLLKHIKDEIEKKHQILIVYPLVEQSEALGYQSIDEAREYWEKNFENVYVTHGKDKEKEEVLLSFKDNGSILIATTVVEVGISLPDLSTVVIVGAERLGLSTLHQLRGRVSRMGLDGYCYLYTNQKESKRLDEFVKTQSGFDIAMLDLKYRKSGDLLKGEAQSGTQFRYIDLSRDENIIKKVKQDLEKIYIKQNKSFKKV